MKLINEIIDLASNDHSSLSGLLRKLLVLAHQLKNQRLKDWVTAELNGYSNGESLPEYRVTRGIAKGNFRGGFGSSISGQIIPPAGLEKQHRRFAETVELTQPIASYDLTKKEDQETHGGIIEWPPNLVIYYQRKFFDGDMAMVSAWQEIPSSVIAGLCDTVRTRVLQFALELKDDLGEVSDNPAQLSPEKVESKVTNYIFGGTNVIAGEASQFEQTSHITVNQNDIVSLQSAMSTLGISQDDFKALTHAMDEDKKEAGDKNLGQKTASWIASIGKSVGKESLKVGSDVAKAAAMSWIKQHLGL